MRRFFSRTWLLWAWLLTTLLSYTFGWGLAKLIIYWTRGE